MNDKTIDTARRRAEEIVLANVDPRVGLLGGQHAYHQVWAREAAICTLGLALSKEGVAVARRSLETLRRFQSPLGNIPHNVGFPSGTDQALLAFGTAKQDRPKDAVAAEAGDGEVNGEPAADTAHAGCIDSALWFIVAQWYLHRVQCDPGHLREAWPSMQRALLWLRYQDSNECGLLEAHEAMDWADLFAHRYNTLNANVRSWPRLSARMGRSSDAWPRTSSSRSTCCSGWDRARETAGNKSWPGRWRSAKSGSIRCG